MDAKSPLLVVTPNEDDRVFANQIAVSLGYGFANIVTGTVYDAAAQLGVSGYTPKYVILDIGTRSYDILPELERLAEHCEVGTKVIVIGQTNDISFYRQLKDQGVLEYLTAPVTADDVLRPLLARAVSEGGAKGEVIAFIGGGAGDGSSMTALNTAYALATQQKEPVVLVDLDYQFGMVAKQLDLVTPFGTKEIFEHPERGVDATLIKRMVISYKDKLDIIAAPNSLGFLPNIPPEIIRDTVHALQQRYRYVVLDVPHLWTHWVSTALNSSNQIVLVGQMWLKSATHCARLLSTWHELGIDRKKIILVVNRSGSKFKDAIHPRDFERVCGRPINVYLPNDIKSVVKAENQGITTMELGDTLLATEIQKLAELIRQSAPGMPSATAKIAGGRR